jgi:hypothetical protein
MSEYQETCDCRKTQPEEKPPLGLKPFRIHRAERLSEIAHAMNRYASARIGIPNEWIAEFQTLCSTFYNEEV